MYGEREEWIEHLSGTDSEIGISRREAELRTLDLDLWIQTPEVLHGFEPEEAVEQWTKAVEAMDSLVPVADLINEATAQCVLDARERAQEALVRARKRLEKPEAG
jgi:hypothetical protein